MVNFNDGNFMRVLRRFAQIEKLCDYLKKIVIKRVKREYFSWFKAFLTELNATLNECKKNYNCLTMFHHINY